MRKPPLFVLDNSVIRAMSHEEVYETATGLRSLGLFRLPAQACVVEAPAAAIVREHFVAPKLTVDLSLQFRVYAEQRPNDGIAMSLLPIVNCTFSLNEIESRIGQEAVHNTKCYLINRLICALATRNVEKSVRHHKLKKLGIGKKEYPFSSTTTIRVPNTRHLPDDNDHPPTGRNVRAHFRRGFIRDQRYGAGNQLIKSIWIAPVFVNADGDWLDQQQKTYRLVA